jgi:hypothetical protein
VQKPLEGLRLRQHCAVSNGYSCEHFSLSNPDNDGADDLPRLLRRVADVMEEYGIRPIDILDLTVSQEIAGGGPWWSVTVYWSPDAEEDPPA